VKTPLSPLAYIGLITIGIIFSKQAFRSEPEDPGIEIPPISSVNYVQGSTQGARSVPNAPAQWIGTWQTGNITQSVVLSFLIREGAIKGDLHLLGKTPATFPIEGTVRQGQVKLGGERNGQPFNFEGRFDEDRLSGLMTYADGAGTLVVKQMMRMHPRLRPMRLSATAA